MKRFTGLLSRTKSSQTNPHQPDSAPVDSPEATTTRSIRLFCESSSSASSDDDYLHLPAIVEAAESSPQATSAAAQQIRKYLSKEYASKPLVQYNSIMLVRILADNPGRTFTRCFDERFVKTVKELLRNCRDGGVQQILRETLDALEVNKQDDEGVAGLVAMWRKEKGSNGSMRPPVPASGLVRRDRRQQSEHTAAAFQQHKQLPAPLELASRVEEARNTAKILLQLLQSTPREEILTSELAQEFNERCKGAQQNMLEYINSDNPAPDDDTMLTLIETNEQLSLAGTRYQRVLLEARRALGMNTSPPPEVGNGGHAGVVSPVATEQSKSLFAAVPSQRHPQNGHGASNITGGRSEEVYQAPPGPPPQQQQQLQQLYPQASQTAGAANDPFADPDAREAIPNQPTRAPNAYASSQAPYAANQRHNTADLENAYNNPPVSPTSPMRPGSGPDNTAGPTHSYLGQQESAANGLTKHEAQPRQNIAEIDEHSTFGRDNAEYGIREVEAGRRGDGR